VSCRRYQDFVKSKDHRALASARFPASENKSRRRFRCAGGRMEIVGTVYNNAPRNAGLGTRPLIGKDMEKLAHDSLASDSLFLR